MWSSIIALNPAASTALLPDSLKTLAVFNKAGLRNFWVLSDGGHEWANWRRYLWQTAQIMFPNGPASGVA